MEESPREADDHVPLIDMSNEDAEASQELFQALSTVGFACLTNTGLWNLAEDYSDNAKKFFELPFDEKNKYAKPEDVKQHGGWASFGRETLNKQRPGDYKEIFNLDRIIVGNADRSPPLIDNAECDNLRAKFEEQCKRVLYLVGLGLELKDPYQLVKAHNFTDAQANPSNFRVAWYPKVDKESVKPEQIRCGEHSDYGSITLLYTSSPGLQVMHRQLGEYVDAGYIEGGIFVNIGDMLQMWSGDILVANKHRVVIPEETYFNEDRVSVAFFGQPDRETLIETLDGTGKYPPITVRQWLLRKHTSAYA